MAFQIVVSSRPRSHPFRRNHPLLASKKLAQDKKLHIHKAYSISSRLMEYPNSLSKLRWNHSHILLPPPRHVPRMGHKLKHSAAPLTNTPISRHPTATEIDSYHDVPCVAITISPQSDVRVDPKIILCTFNFLSAITKHILHSTDTNRLEEDSG